MCNIQFGIKYVCCHQRGVGEYPFKISLKEEKIKRWGGLNKVKKFDGRGLEPLEVKNEGVVSLPY